MRRPSKIVCVGRNYLAHAAELGNDVPAEPLVFMKPPSSLVTDGGPIVLPADAGRVDFEGEIAVVVARTARHVSEEDAWDHLSHVVALNDVTARELQRSDGQWTRAKGFDTFCPMGTPVSTEGLDPAALAVVTTVNGEERQRGRSSDMAFSIPMLVAWISRVMTLEPGDVISTGTPEGVGPLTDGDRVAVRVLVDGANEDEPLSTVTSEVRASGAS